MTEPAPSKRNGCWTLFKLFLGMGAVLVLIGIAGVFLLFLAYQQVVQPGVPGKIVSVTVPEGATGKDIGKLLAAEDLIEHEILFRIALRIEGAGGPLKHGRYELPQGLSASQLLERLRKGPTQALKAEEIPDECKVTIPEGLTIAQTADLFPNPGAFIKAASDPAHVARLGIQADTLEGFLMPNTYFFDEQPEESDVIRRMVLQFEKEYAALTEEIPGAADYDKNTIVTVASLVEEEARVDDERALVAAVIYNRLDRNMALQMDSTIQYALKKYGQRILYEDRETDSPYNTYKHTGLPPGPISNPGVASLRAAMQPAQEDYLYFVSNADGKTHTFSSTDAEHVRAVRRFRREIAPQRRENQ